MDAVYLTIRSINAVKRAGRSDSKAADLELKTEKTKCMFLSTECMKNPHC